MTFRYARTILICLYVTALIALLAAIAGAQELKQSGTAAPVFSTPVLSEAQQSQVQNLNLRATIIQMQLNDAEHMKLDADKDKAVWQKEVLILKKMLEIEHPGWNWSPEDGQWTKIPAAETPSAPTKDKKK